MENIICCQHIIISLIPSAVMPQIPFNWIMKLASNFNMKLKIRNGKSHLGKIPYLF